MGGRRKHAKTGRARAGCACTGGARWPGASAAREEATAGTLRTKCTRGDPSAATSSRKGPGATTRRTGTGPARSRPPSTGPVFAKCPATVVPAKPRFSQLGLAGNVAGASPGIAGRAELQKALPMERLFMLRSVGRVERLVRRSSTSEGGSDTHLCRCAWRWVSLRSTHPTKTTAENS